MPDYVTFVEVCRRCGSLITWDAQGKGICACGDPQLDFMEREKSIELGILKESS